MGSSVIVALSCSAIFASDTDRFQRTLNPRRSGLNGSPARAIPPWRTDECAAASQTRCGKTFRLPRRILLSGLQRSPGGMIHRLCSICAPRYRSSGCQNVISTAGSLVRWPLSRLRAQRWNMALPIPGGCNVNMLFLPMGTTVLGRLTAYKCWPFSE